MPDPTDAELAILHVLWSTGPSTVRAVHEALHADDGITYTTTLKTLQNMAHKGLVSRDERERSHVYAAAVDRQLTRGSLVSGLLDRAFAGSAAQLVLSALSYRPTSREELAEIRALLDELEERP
jgi:predicted transcriptional regulator